MILQISNAVDTDTVKSIVAGLDAGQFSDGKKTAGWAAKDVKNNQQLSGKKSEAATQVLLDRLQQNALVQSVMRPKQVARVTINRYQQGEYLSLIHI